MALTLLEAWVVPSNNTDVAPRQGRTDRLTCATPNRWGQEARTILLRLWVDSDEKNACFLNADANALERFTCVLLTKGKKLQVLALVVLRCYCFALLWLLD